MTREKTMEYEEEFEMFWATYPRRVGGKKHTHARWRKAIPEAGAEVILEAVKAQIRSGQLDAGQYTPYPATWINQGRWEDEAIGASEESEPSIGEGTRNIINIARGRAV
jgi:hypothetical protein